MTRRTFAALLALGPGISRGDVILEGIYGARLPHTLRLNRRLVGAGFPALAEIRVYEGDGQVDRELAAIFSRAGVRPMELGQLKFLFPFRSLEERAKDWNCVNVSPEWTAVRDRVRLTEMTLYRRAQS